MPTFLMSEYHISPTSYCFPSFLCKLFFCREAMKSMHIIQSDGTALKGAAAFEVMYVNHIRIHRRITLIFSYKYSGGPLFGTLSKLISYMHIIHKIICIDKK